jgi:D-alanine-D-alanine ligase
MLGAYKREETVAVLFGGRSSEHEISLRSAALVLRSIPEPFQVIPVGIDRSGRWLSLEGCAPSRHFASVDAEDLAVFLAGGKPLNMGGTRGVETVFLPQPFDSLSRLPESTVRLINLEAGLFFPVLHGTNGEDGRLQGLFDLAEVAYVGPDHTSSALGMDKSVAKRLAEHAGVPTIPWQEVNQAEFREQPDDVLARVIEKLKFPVFVKPNALGSAVGVSRATDRASLLTSLERALAFDERALVEESANGTEVECAFLGTPWRPRVSQPGEIAPKDFYSYEEKYGADSPAELYVPARLDSHQAQQLRGMALQVARALNIEGMSRIDFWWRAQSGELFFNEVNTLPGMTSISMFPKLWELEGVHPTRWIAEALAAGQARLKVRLARSYGH